MIAPLRNRLAVSAQYTLKIVLTTTEYDETGDAVEIYHQTIATRDITSRKEFNDAISLYATRLASAARALR